MAEIPHPNVVFWIDLAKVKPNPFQPRKYFDEEKLKDLSDSIRRYGVLQPIVVSRNEEYTPDGGMQATYEIIAGERRYRASQMAGLSQIPAIVREGEHTEKEKLELAILENLQREDLNPVDKARSFNRLIQEFELTHAEVAERLGKSREYVSNSLRLLALPEDILQALTEGKISEGHTRPLLMLKERPDEQMTLFRQMLAEQGMTVREAEKFARNIAVEKVRKPIDAIDPELLEFERRLQEKLGTTVQINKQVQGGKITIDFFTPEDLQNLLARLDGPQTMMPAPSVAAAAPQILQQPITPVTTASSLQEEMSRLADQSKDDKFSEVPKQPASGWGFNTNHDPSKVPFAQVELPDPDKFVAEFNTRAADVAPEAVEQPLAQEVHMISNTFMFDESAQTKPQPKDADDDLYNLSKFSV